MSHVSTGVWVGVAVLASGVVSWALSSWLDRWKPPAWVYAGVVVAGLVIIVVAAGHDQSTVRSGGSFPPTDASTVPTLPDSTAPPTTPSPSASPQPTASPVTHVTPPPKPKLSRFNVSIGTLCEDTANSGDSQADCESQAKVVDGRDLIWQAQTFNIDAIADWPDADELVDLAHSTCGRMVLHFAQPKDDEGRWGPAHVRIVTSKGTTDGVSGTGKVGKISVDIESGPIRIEAGVDTGFSGVLFQGTASCMTDTGQ